MIKGNRLLDVRNLYTYFFTYHGTIRAVAGVSFFINTSETVGLIGETGCGKSVTALSILRLILPPGKIESGKVLFWYKGELSVDLLSKDEVS